MGSQSDSVMFKSLVGMEFNVLTLNSGSMLAAHETCAFLFIFFKATQIHVMVGWDQQADLL